jgi:hypothetical protein
VSVEQSFRERLVSIGAVTVISNDAIGDMVLIPIVVLFQNCGEFSRLPSSAGIH